MSQPPHIQRVIPCECGSTDVYWHGHEDGRREYCCDACWRKLRRLTGRRRKVIDLGTITAGRGPSSPFRLPDDDEHPIQIITTTPDDQAAPLFLDEHDVSSLSPSTAGDPRR